MLNLTQFQPKVPQARSQFNRQQPVTVPEIPFNYDPQIEQARNYTQVPIEQESIPTLLKRLAVARANQAGEMAVNFLGYALPIKIGFAAVLFLITCGITRPILVHLVPLQPAQVNSVNK